MKDGKDTAMTTRQDGRSEGRNKFPDGFRILQGKQEYITYLDHSSIRIWPSDTAAHFDQHTHSAIEIIMPQRGVSVYHMLDAVYRVQAGEILIVPSGCPHELTEYRDTIRYLLLFEPNPLLNLRDMPSISAMMQQPIYLHDDPETAKQVSDLLMQAVDCYFRKEPMWNTQCYSYLLQMYALLGQKYMEGTPQRVVSQRNIDPAIMNSAITYINEHYMNDISLEDVAVFAGFSKCYFSRTFKQFSGVSFLEYLTRKRLNVAADLLVRTNQPIHEVAKKSGFGSTATFNRVFRDHKNCTPSQYRAIYSMGVDPEKDKMLL